MALANLCLAAFVLLWPLAASQNLCECSESLRVIPFAQAQPRPIADGHLQPARTILYQNSVAYLGIPVVSDKPSDVNISSLIANAVTFATGPSLAPSSAPTETLPAQAASQAPEAANTTVPSASTSTNATSSSSSTGAELDIPKLLTQLNGFRARHMAPALSWSPDLAAYAANWTSACNFKHSNGPWGENLCLGFANWADCQSAWYNERTNYNFELPGFTAGTGHFTEQLWRSVLLVGCASTSCPSLNGIFYACEYAPHGNVIGEFQDNVLPSADMM